MLIGMKHLLKEWQVGDGREEKVALRGRAGAPRGRGRRDPRDRRVFALPLWEKAQKKVRDALGDELLADVSSNLGHVAGMGEPATPG
jgi:hypothetical protein